MFVKMPNLPEGKVKTVLVSGREQEIVLNLSSLGINVIKVYDNDYLEPNISSHPDMNFLHLGDNKYLSYSKILNDSYKFYKESIPIKNDYLNSTKLNMVIIGKYCICNKRTCTQYIDNIDKEFIFVNQGYTKCSTLVIDGNSLITGDPGIYNETKKRGINALLINNSDVVLDGYENGFVGGIGGKLSKDILAISGRLDNLKDKDKIKSFCRNSGVYIEELTNSAVRDVGSIIPIEQI